MTYHIEPQRGVAGEIRRSLDSNALMWVLLGEIAKQLEWPVNGKTQKLTAEDWKDILSSGLHKEQRIAQGVEGGFVLLGLRTSKMTKAQMGELIEFIYWFGADKDIKFGAAPSYEQYRESMK